MDGYIKQEERSRCGCERLPTKGQRKGERGCGAYIHCEHAVAPRRILVGEEVYGLAGMACEGSRVPGVEDVIGEHLRENLSIKVIIYIFKRKENWISA